MWRDVGAGIVRMRQEQPSISTAHRPVILVAVAGLFLAYAIGIFLPQRTMSATLRREREQLQQQISTSTTELTTRSAEAGENLESATRMALEVPSHDHTSPLIEELLFQSRQVGLTTATMKRQPDRVSDSLYTLSLIMVVRGSYDQLTNFLGGLVGMTRLVDVGSMQIHAAPAAAADAPALEATLELRAYRFQEAVSPDAGSAALDATGDE